MHLVAAQANRGWPGSVSEVVSSVMPKDKKKFRTAIYHPPKAGMPYLVVTVSPEGVIAVAVDSKDEARILASKKAMKVSLQDSTNKP